MSCGRSSQTYRCPRDSSICRGNTPAGEIQDFYQDNMIKANWLSAGTAGSEKITLTFEKGSGATKERCMITIYTLDDKTIVEIQLDPAK
jgi:hypothetical protein